MGLFDFAWPRRTDTGTSRFPIWYLKKYHYICSPKAKATLAQLVEQLIRNEQVVGSSPMSGSNPFTYILMEYQREHCFFLCRMFQFQLAVMLPHYLP